MSSAPPDDESPALHITVTLGAGIGPADADVVPAIQLPDWPDPAKNWNPRWMSDIGIMKCRSTAHVVAKLHESGWC